MKEKKKALPLLVGVLIAVIAITIGVSYATWQITLTQQTLNSIVTGCLKIELTDENEVNLESTYPKEDAEGMKLTPYTFRIRNACNNRTSFQINLETLAVEAKKLPDKYLKVNLSEKNVSKITTKLDKTVNAKLETNTTIENATEAYKLLNGVLDANETKEYHLRLWLSEDTAPVKEAMNATYKGKISVTASEYIDNRGTLKAANLSEKTTTGEFWDYKDRIVKLVIEDKMAPKETELSWDVSEKNDGSVMSYLVPLTEEEISYYTEELIRSEFDMTLEEYKNYLREEGMEEEEINQAIEKLKNNIRSLYTLYIQSDGGLIANSNSSYLFSEWQLLMNIEGLEYLDTSKVTNMSNMFHFTSQDSEFGGEIKNLDLSHFDTRNVTEMAGMFYGISSLENLDLSSFDTSKVTNMHAMFANLKNMKSLDLSGFDTSNVTDMMGMFFESAFEYLNISNFNTSNVTDMQSMFYGTELKTLDISHFDTSNVTDMSDMFRNMIYLTSLDLGENFSTSNVTDMASMFNSCSSLTNLDLSHFDTTKVTNMELMFKDMNNLTTLDISNFNTTNVTNMGQMFDGMTSLTTLDISNFDMSNVKNKTAMFRNLPDSTQVYVKDVETQTFILNLQSNRPNAWTTGNVLIKS